MVIVILAMMGLWGYLLGLWATKKGYEFWNWFFASSLLGTIWLACSRNVVKENMSDTEKADVVRKGNTTGVVLSAINVILSFFYLLSNFNL